MMKSSIKALILSSIFGALVSCTSQPIIPKSTDIKVGRSAPGDKCKEIGLLRGTTMLTSGTKEEALEDLKKMAANKGATYVKVEQFSALGTSVTGFGYKCP